MCVRVDESMTHPGPTAPGSGAGGCCTQCRLDRQVAAQRRIHLPRDHVGRHLRLPDGTAARVYRETVVGRGPAADPCVLVVAFRLRGVRGRGHALFRWESLLNTPLFVGFPGLVSKLWLAHDSRGTYRGRGLYEWDGPRAAAAYARALWRVLALVSVTGSIDYRIAPGLRRDDILADRRGWVAASPRVSHDLTAAPAVHVLLSRDADRSTRRSSVLACPSIVHQPAVPGVLAVRPDGHVGYRSTQARTFVIDYDAGHSGWKKENEPCSPSPTTSAPNVNSPSENRVADG